MCTWLHTKPTLSDKPLVNSKKKLYQNEVIEASLRTSESATNRAIVRSIIGGGGGRGRLNIHIFVFSPTNFLSN